MSLSPEFMERLKLRGPQRRRRLPLQLPVPGIVRGELFLKGPIPLNWLSTAMALGGHALHVAVVLWFLAGLKRSRQVDLSLSRMEDHGVSRRAAGRGLTSLENAGLVTVDRSPGRRPRVTLVVPSGDVGASVSTP